MRDNPWIRVFRCAALQFGAIARWQAIGLGIDDTSFTRRVRSEQWRQPHRGVYVIPGTTWGPMTRLSSALLAIGDHAAATGVTALHLHGIVEQPPAHTTLVVPHSRRAPPLGAVRVLRSRTLLPDDVTVVRRLRSATAPRALLDAAPMIPREELRVMLINGRQRQIVLPEQVAERALMSSVRQPGRRRLLSAASDVSKVGADSAFSDAVHRRLITDGLVPDDDPVAVEVGGRRLHPDITFAHARVCIECDSLAHHSDQRAIDLDHRKDQAYGRARWKCLRIGWRRFDRDWPGFVSVVRGALREWPVVVAALAR